MYTEYHERFDQVHRLDIASFPRLVASFSDINFLSNKPTIIRKSFVVCRKPMWSFIVLEIQCWFATNTPRAFESISLWVGHVKVFNFTQACDVYSDLWTAVSSKPDVN
jgi:hypothetical protein